MAKQQKTTRASASSRESKPVSAGEPASLRLPLSNLHLDGNNPRLGARSGQITNEVEILDTIVDVFGIDDVLSSLAVNGYFEAEPLVGVRIQPEGHVKIAEGNRRLAACLILAGDERARNQERRTKEYQALQTKHQQPKITEIPVRVLEDTRNLLSYLGVRHIAASQPWDSYAKAAWVAKVLDQGHLTLEDVSEMIGDQHRTVARTLEGYYFINQLIDAARFSPDDSLRPGRGSNPEYPFSWVYTALGFAPIREWLRLTDLAERGRQKKPLKSKETLDDGAELLVFLFGNKGTSRSPAITDSRQIAKLAQAVADDQSLRLLKRGKTVEDVAQFLKPAKERVADSLFDAQESLSSALTPLSQGEIGEEEAEELLSPSKKVRALATEVNKKVVALATGDEE
jgi:hypothetical protein